MFVTQIGSLFMIRTERRSGHAEIGLVLEE